MTAFYVLMVIILALIADATLHVGFEPGGGLWSW